MLNCATVFFRRRAASGLTDETTSYTTTVNQTTRFDNALDESNQQLFLYCSCQGRRGRPPVGLSRMLRMYVAQQCFGLSDEGIEDAIYDSQAIRGFVGIDLSREGAPDATTLLDFRHLLEQHQLTESIFNAIAHHLAAKGLLLREGSIVDATLIAAPPSTKNKAGKRDPEMHQSKKGNQWHFGMKAHIGVDAHSGFCLLYTSPSPRDRTRSRMPSSA